MKTGKKPGPDSIPPEAIKAEIETSTEMLHELFEQIWEEKYVPEQWKDEHLIKLPKKVNLKESKIQRGMMLLSVSSKVLDRVVLDRVTTTLDTELRDQQAGFRNDRSCTDHIATLIRHLRRLPESICQP